MAAKGLAFGQNEQSRLLMQRLSRSASTAWCKPCRMNNLQRRLLQVIEKPKFEQTVIGS
jgi:hypothetical protein